MSYSNIGGGGVDRGNPVCSSRYAILDHRQGGTGPPSGWSSTSSSNTIAGSGAFLNVFRVKCSMDFSCALDGSHESVKPAGIPQAPT